ncbi:9114_t:CDS:1 [Ambispora leptoticha]|uniref:9114_t:CDS:1 n=1 Tax=Ambispora leptoticha TaxID=144679 RepID=A0A9N9CV38_9GLOM|nr:9114_t:CDS:1 [Ambispora leptoticha]
MSTLEHIKRMLLSASKDLYYISESEESFEFVYFPNVFHLPSTALEFASEVSGRDVSILEQKSEQENWPQPQVIEFDEFFANLIKNEDEVSETTMNSNSNYRALQESFYRAFVNDDNGNSKEPILKENPKVYRVPREYSGTRVDIYIVGLFEGVGVAGLKTLSIES